MQPTHFLDIEGPSGANAPYRQPKQWALRLCPQCLSQGFKAPVVADVVHSLPVQVRINAGAPFSPNERDRKPGECSRVVRYHQELQVDVLCGLCSVSVARVMHLTHLSISHTQVPPLERHLSGTRKGPAGIVQQLGKLTSSRGRLGMP